MTIPHLTNCAHIGDGWCLDCVKSVVSISSRDRDRDETFDGYQREAARTGGRDLLPENRDKGLNCAAMGLAGESGEVCDLVKKVQHHLYPLDEDELKKEIGDVLWYVAHTCNVMGWRMAQVAAANIAKLRRRYPDGFTASDSMSRRDAETTTADGEAARPGERERERVRKALEDIASE